MHKRSFDSERSFDTIQLGYGLGLEVSNGPSRLKGRENMDKNMTEIIATLIALQLKYHEPIMFDHFGLPCEQIAPVQCLPLASGDFGSWIDPNKPDMQPPSREFLNIGIGMYDVFGGK